NGKSIGYSHCPFYFSGCSKWPPSRPGGHFTKSCPMTDVFTLDPAVILDFALKVGLATLAGVFIGLEREYKGKSAGLKTNTLVSLGACTFVLISLDFQGGENVDVTRVLGQVVTGIGFLGAG